MCLLGWLVGWLDGRCEVVGTTRHFHTDESKVSGFNNVWGRS